MKRNSICLWGAFFVLASLILPSLGSISGSYVYAAGDDSSNGSGGEPTLEADACRTLLDRFHPQGASARQLRSTLEQARRESHSLMQFFAPDEQGESMATRHPLIGMNAGQRFLAMLYEQGYRQVRSLQDGTTIYRRFAALYDGVKEAEGRRLIGHEHVGDVLVQHMEMAADGFKAGLKVWISVGNPGSGKSESREVLRTIAKNKSLSDPRFFLYTYDYINLHDIPELRLFFPPNEDGITLPVSEPQNKSPLCLLPEVYKQAVLNQINPKVVEMIERDADPRLTLSPKSQFIRDKIIEHYTQKDIAEGRGEPGPDRVMSFLNRHVRIKRFIYGDPGTFPTINFQGKGVNLGALLMRPDMAMQAVVPDHHPMAHQYGQIVSADGGVVLLEEVLKNDENMQNALLDVIQARRYSIEGAAPVEFDVVFMGTTNTDDILKLQEKAKSHKQPILDRGTFSYMNWSVLPHEIMQILMYDVPNMQMLALDGSMDTPVLVRERGAMQRLVQRPEGLNQPWQGPDERFRVFSGPVHGSQSAAVRRPVEISPHSLLFVSRVVALSRMVLEPNAVKKALADFGRNTDEIPAPPLFTSAVERLSLLEGRGEFQNSTLREYWAFSQHVNEGAFGISARDASTWFSLAIKEAEKAGYGHTVTPILLNSVLQRMIRERTIGTNDAERTHISALATTVSLEMTIPDVRRDLTRAILATEGDDLEHTYDLVFAELIAEGNARLRGQTVQVSEVTQRVRELFKQITRRDLDAQEIAMSMAHNLMAGGAQTVRRNQDLMQAVTRHMVDTSLARNYTKLSRLYARLVSGGGSGQDRRAAEEDIAREDRIIEYLRYHLGYSPAAVLQAMSLVLTMSDIQVSQQ